MHYLARKLFASAQMQTQTMKRGLFTFSSTASKKLESEISLEDWQYCKIITSELKLNNVNSAMSYLFQSYFSQKVLDIQIYNSINQKLSELALPLSYSEILYLVYRDHFAPHPLLSNLMGKLTYSKNQQLVKLLKKDYETIGKTFPIKTAQKHKKQIKLDKIQTKPSTKLSEGTENEELKNLAQEMKEKAPGRRTGRNIKIKQPLNEFLASSEDLKDLGSTTIERIEEIISALSTFSKITLSDVEINISEEEEEDDEEEEEDEYATFSKEDENDEDDDDMSINITKIKIGKIQLINNKSDHKNDPADLD